MRRFIAIATPILGLFVLTWAQTFFSAAAVVAVPACSTFDANPLGEITGIEVLADTLTAGHGCGQGAGQIYKYISVVTAPLEAGVLNSTATPGEFLAGASTDCFANATFINLCTYLRDTIVNGVSVNEQYDVAVYAFTADQWNLVNPTSDEAGAADSSADAGATDASPAGSGSVDASSSDAAITDASAADADASRDAGAPVATAPQTGDSITSTINTANGLAALANTAASPINTVCGTPDAGLVSLSDTLLASAGWVTHCQAIQQSNIPVLAQCGPLVQLR